MSGGAHGFVDWKEQFVSQERGSRVVHYYLKDASGESVLAVVGTERSIRHMVYVVAEKFLQDYGSEKSINACLKWRSKREVVDWLTSWLSKQHSPQDCLRTPTNDSAQVLGSPNFSMNKLGAPGAHLPDHTGQFSRKLKGHHSDILWLGVTWTCGKQLKHYPAFCRDGTTIAIHSFVLIMSKEENHYLAYLEDMYEDRKGQKKVKVRWFHYNQEVKGVISLPNPHPREIFITPYAQVISAECVDGPATVLTPEHYEKCMTILPHTSTSKIYLCFRQFRSNKVKPFDLSKLWGYFDQEILSCLEEEEEFSQGGTIKRGTKRTRSCRGYQKFVTSRSDARISDCGNQITACGPAYQNLRFGSLGRRPQAVKFVGPQPFHPSFKVDEKIEFLCQDSGIRGCWFRCTILQVSRKQLKVLYDDLQDEDGCGNLEEWIPAFRLAAPDKLGMRCSGRLTIRPRHPPENPMDGIFEIGAPVDAWWNDGWWEGVITRIGDSGDGSLQVYFPGEDMFSTFQRSDLRCSRDWVGNQWVDIKAKPDILSSISVAVSPGPKLSACSTIARGTESGGSAMSDREVPTTTKLDTIEEDKQELAGSAGFDGLQENVSRPWTDDEGKKVDVDNVDEDDGHVADASCKDDKCNEDELEVKEEIMAADLKCEAEPLEVVV